MRVAAAVTRLISSAAGTLATTDDGAAVSRSHVSVRRRLSATIPLPIRCCSTVNDPRSTADRCERGRKPRRIDVGSPARHHQLAHVIAHRPGSGATHSPDDRCPIGQPGPPVSRWSAVSGPRTLGARLHHPPPIDAGPIGRARECPRRARRRRGHERCTPRGGTARAQANEPAEVISRLPGGGGPWTNFNTDASISADGRFVVFNSERVGPGRFDTRRCDPRPHRRHHGRRAAVPELATPRSATTAVWSATRVRAETARTSSPTTAATTSR